MTTEKPRRTAGTFCPLWRRDVSKVCHTCEWYILVRGKHPQSDETIDQWGCSIGFLPWLTVENSQMQRQTGAAVESFRNEMVKANQQMLAVAVQRPRLVKGPNDAA